MCITIHMNYKNDVEEMANLCDHHLNDNHLVLGGPITDDAWQGLANVMFNFSKWANYEPWIGMKRKKSSNGGWNSGNKKWEFLAGGEEVDEDSYPLWENKPSMASDGNDCAVLKLYKHSYKVKNTNCELRHRYICQKKENPCQRVNGVSYTDYDGMCLAYEMQPESATSMNAAFEICSDADGDLLSYKNDSNRETLVDSMSSGVHQGGVFIGLKKDSSGNWKYLDGSPGPDESMWDPEMLQYDCGYIRIRGDKDLKLISLPCDYKTSFLCRKPTIRNWEQCDQRLFQSPFAALNQR